MSVRTKLFLTRFSLDETVWLLEHERALDAVKLIHEAARAMGQATRALESCDDGIGLGNAALAFNRAAHSGDFQEFISAADIVIRAASKLTGGR